MTIFIMTAKKIIKVMIESTRVASTEADRSTTNWALSVVGFGRDLTLSEAKREHITALLPKINELDDSLDDKVALDKLQGLIRQCKHDMAEQTTKHKIGTGNTEEALEGICSLLQAIYDKLNLLNLLNTPYDVAKPDPLDNFKKHVAFFYAEKFTAEHSLNILSKLTRVPVRKDKIELTEQQNILITESLSTLSAHMSSLDNLFAYSLQNKQQSEQQRDQEARDYQRSKHFNVFNALQTLNTFNEKLCMGHQPAIGLALLNPDDGILTERLKIALAEIGSPYQLNLPTLRRPVTSSIPDATEELDHPPTLETNEGIATPENSGSTHAVLTALQAGTLVHSALQPINPSTSEQPIPTAALSKQQQRKMKKLSTAASRSSEDEPTASPP